MEGLPGNIDHEINFIDQELLEVKEYIEDVIINEDETALFECKIVKHVETICNWFKNGIVVELDERTTITEDGGWHRLEIRRVTVSDHGIYTLECTHHKTYISVKGHLHVAPRLLREGYFDQKILCSKKPGFEMHLKNINVLKGEIIMLEAKFDYKLLAYNWYRNQNIIEKDQRTTIIDDVTAVSLKIINADPTDTGVYFVVGSTKQGPLSSFAEVLVSDRNDQHQTIPTIEELLPEETGALVGEETRLIVKAHTDIHTDIKWYRNNLEIDTADFIKVDYGNNYFGLIIKYTQDSLAGKYRFTLSKGERSISTSTRVIVSDPPVPPVIVNIIHSLESAVTCCGAKVSFDCSFDLQNPIYFYVVWYVGNYKIERSNSLFNVIYSGSHFLLYIEKVKLSMAGLVMCELRRAWPNQSSSLIIRTHARLVIIPPCLIKEKNPHNDLSKLHDRETLKAGIRTRIEDDLSMRLMAHKMSDICFDMLVKYCRLDEDGLFYAHAIRSGLKTIGDSLFFYNNGKDKVMEWSHKGNSTCWFGIDLQQTNGSFAAVGITSYSSFSFEDPPIGQMLVFRIRSVEPIENAIDSTVFIVPPPEIELRLPVPHEIQTIDAFNKKYTETENIIGTGSFGRVVMVRDKTDKAYYAAKFVQAKIVKSREHSMREFNVMKSLRHPKLIELIGFYESRMTMYIYVMEYCWGGELFDRVVKEEYLKEMDVIGYVKQICEGLEYMHSKNIVHLDLKPENIICLSPNSRQVKLIDFGLARKVTDEFAKSLYGTLEYIAPEVVVFDSITTASDMWSLGVVTYTLLSGLLPFAGDTWTQQSANITRAKYDYDDFTFNEVSDLAKNFVDNLLLRQPEKRITATNALQHPWIKEGPPKIYKNKHMTKMRENLKSYLADYRSRWQRAGNVMIAAHRLRMRGRQEPKPKSHKEPRPDQCAV